jgi:hypothetical protein
MNPNDIALLEVDTLGLLLAQIAELTKKADKIKDDIKDVATLLNGDKVIAGNLFKATVVEANRNTIDWLAIMAAKLDVELNPKDKDEESWKKVAIKMGFDQKELPKTIADNTKVSAVFSVKVTSR